MKRVYIKQIESYLPEKLVNDRDLISSVENENFSLDIRVLCSIIGTRNRYHAARDQQVSDLAVEAAKKILINKSNSEIDLLIFAAASSDLIEPATANIVHDKLALECPSFDVKNACNSVTSAIEIASAMILSGAYQNVLIVSGEKPSDSIRYDGLTKENIAEHIAAFSFGDAGVAILLEGTDSPSRGFIYQKSKTFGEYWNLCRILGGGSMYPKDASKLVFSGETYQLKKIIDEIGPKFVRECLHEANITPDQIHLICAHQVSKNTASGIASHLQIGIDKVMDTFELYGNTASTSMPLALELAFKNNRVKQGDLVMLLGLAAGINLSVQLMYI